MARRNALALGLDFGTAAVRALLLDLQGREAGGASARYRHSQILHALPGDSRPLPPAWALQHPADWTASAARATRAALRAAGADPAEIISIGVDFTSCTVLPCSRDATPLCLVPEFRGHPHAWPKLWKHHAAAPQTERINRAARRARVSWLARYGGAVGVEWLWPKLLEVAEHDPAILRAADTWIEAGDWFVWWLTGFASPNPLRSTCQAGYKACWAPPAKNQSGYPSERFLRSLHPMLADAPRTLLRGEHAAPGALAGNLARQPARALGLREGTPVSAAVIDAHAGVPGVGVADPGVLVMVLGTSACHMLMSDTEKLVPGVAGIVRDGILPGLVGYETGQAAVGDSLAWVASITRTAQSALARAAAEVPPGAAGVRGLDWFNGCRTPLMDPRLAAAFSGISLATTPAQIYRATIESTAFGLRWIVETLRESRVPVRAFVATGGLASRDPALVQAYADTLDAPIVVPSVQEGPARGAAILGVLAAGRAVSGLASAAHAVRTLAPARQGARTYRPRARATRALDAAYRDYRDTAAYHAARATPA